MLTGCVLLAATAGYAAAQAPVNSPPTQINDPVVLLDSSRPRSDEEEDRLSAAGWAARARIHHLRDENEPALECYQKAYFWDDAAREVLPEIVELATDQERFDLAVEYAHLAIRSRALTEPDQLREVARLLAEQGESALAAELYRDSVLEGPNGQRDVQDYIAAFEWARLAYMVGRTAEASKAVQLVWEFIRAGEPADDSQDLKRLYQLLVAESDRPLSLMVDILLASQQGPIAQEVAKLLSDKHPSEPMQAYRQAVLDLLAHRNEAAEQSLNRYQQLRSEEAGTAPYERLAELIDGPDALKKPLSERALGRLETWYSEAPENITLALFLADKMSQAGRADDAIRLYRQILTQQALQPAYVGLLSQLTESGKPAEVLDLLIEFLSLAGNLELLQPALDKLAGNKPVVEKVLAEAQRRIDQKSDGSEVPLIGLTLAAASDLARLPHWLTLSGDEAAPMTDEVALRVGLNLVIAEQFGPAAEVFQLGLKHGEESQRALFLYYLAETMIQREMDEEALQAIEQAVESADESLRPTMLARQGWMLYHNGRTDEAETVLLELIRSIANSKDVGHREPLQQAHMVLSGMYATAHRLAEAEEHLVEVLLDHPRDIGAMNDLAYLWADQGRRLSRSLRMLQHVVNAQPNNAAYRDSLGWVYYRLQRYEEAVDQLRQAAAVAEPDGIILDHLGDALLAFGDRQGAIGAWQHALKRLADDKDDHAASAETISAIERKVEQHRSSTE